MGWSFALTSLLLKQNALSIHGVRNAIRNPVLHKVFLILQAAACAADGAGNAAAGQPKKRGRPPGSGKKQKAEAAAAPEAGADGAAPEAGADGAAAAGQPKKRGRPPGSGKKQKAEAAAAPEAGADGAAAAAQPKRRGRPPGSGKKQRAEAAAPEAPQPVAAADSTAAPAAQPKKRGRPPGSGTPQRAEGAQPEGAQPEGVQPEAGANGAAAEIPSPKKRGRPPGSGKQQVRSDLVQRSCVSASAEPRLAAALLGIFVCSVFDVPDPVVACEPPICILRAVRLRLPWWHANPGEMLAELASNSILAKLRMASRLLISESGMCGSCSEPLGQRGGSGDALGGGRDGNTAQEAWPPARQRQEAEGASCTRSTLHAPWEHAQACLARALQHHAPRL